MKYLISLGFILLFLGIIFIFIGALTSQGKTDTKFAVGGFIGFIPFGFANSRKMLYLLIGLTLVLFIFSMIMLRFYK